MKVGTDMTTTFKVYAKKAFPELDKFTRTIEKVHGENHPELREVRQLFLTIQDKTHKDDFTRAMLTSDIARLQSLTANYTPPADACQAYQKTYVMLKALDETYQK